MADAALFIGWGAPVRGREKAALKVFGESVQFWTQLQQEKRIESFEPALLQAHGGDLAGFALLRGTPEQIAKLRESDDFGRSVLRAGLIVDNLGVVNASLGTALATGLALYQEQLAELT